MEGKTSKRLFGDMKDPRGRGPSPILPHLALFSSSPFRRSSSTPHPHCASVSPAAGRSLNACPRPAPPPPSPLRPPGLQQASCAMPAGPGMKIKTNTPAVKKAREGVMEFLLVRGGRVGWGGEAYAGRRERDRMPCDSRQRFRGRGSLVPRLAPPGSKSSPHPPTHTLPSLIPYAPPPHTLLPVSLTPALSCLVDAAVDPPPPSPSLSPHDSPPSIE